MRNLNQREPPDYLGPEGRAFFVKVCAEYVFDSEPSWRLLEEAAACCDRISQARAVIAKEGLTTKTLAGGERMHPAVTIEKDARILLSRLCRELKFGDEPEEARPPRITGNSRKR